MIRVEAAEPREKLSGQRLLTEDFGFQAFVSTESYLRVSGESEVEN